MTDTARAAGRFVMTAENPGGTIDVSIPVGGIQAEYVPGFEFDVVGVLVPQPGLPGRWQVRPRSPADVLERDP